MRIQSLNHLRPLLCWILRSGGYAYEVVVLIPDQCLPLMLLGTNWTECATTFPRACTPFCRVRDSLVIAVLLVSVNIVRGARDHGYPTATEEKRILQGSNGVQNPVTGRSKMRRDIRLSIFSILPFPLNENMRGRISERSGNVERPGALFTSKQIFFRGNAKVGAGLFAGEIELNTCCVAMVKLLGESCRVVDGSTAPDWPKSCHPGPFPPRVDRVPRGCPSHRCKAKLKHSSSAARTDYIEYNHCSCKCPFVNHRDYNDCTCKTQRPLTSIRWTD